MDEEELLEQMAEYLEDDAPHLLRTQNLSELGLKQAAANKAGYHYSGQWTEEEEKVIDAVASTYQHCFIICARGYSKE